MPDKEVLTGQGESRRILLTAHERRVCKQLVAGPVPQRRRALALMALDQGVTQAEASELSGLTIGQVRYWRDKFHQQRLGIFPGDPSDGPSADSGSVSAEDRPQRESERTTATVAGQPKAESNQGAKKKNSAKTAKKAKRVKGKKKNDKKKAAKKKQRKKAGGGKKKKNEAENKPGKKAKRSGRDRKKTKKKTENPTKGKK